MGDKRIYDNSNIGYRDNVHPLPITHHITLPAHDDHHFASSRYCNNLAYLIFETTALHNYGLFAFCILPHEVHILCRPGNLLVCHFVGLLKFRYEYVLATIGHIRQIWQTEFQELRLDEGEIIACALDIFEKPVKEGLVESAFSYPFSFVLGGKDYAP